MSVRVMTKVWDAAFPTMAMKLVALKLADCANDEGENVYPYVKSIEEATGASESAVREAVADMEASGLLAVTGTMKDEKRIGRIRPIRAFDLDKLEALHRRRQGFVWERVEVPVHDLKTGAPKLNSDGSAKVRQAWRLASSEVQPLDPQTSSHWTSGGPAETGSGVQPMDPPGPATGPRIENPSLEPSLNPSLSPLYPQRSSLPSMGARGIKWIEELREEGLAPAVLDELLAPLVRAGLAPWKALDGASLDPTGPGRQICLDMRHDTIPVLEATREAILNRYKHRLPPVTTVRELATVARAAEARRLAQASRAGELPDITCAAEASQRFRAAIARIAAPEICAAWFDPVGAIVDGERVTIVTPHRPGLVDNFASSHATAAARVAFGRDVFVEFKQGRPVVSQGAA